MVLFYAGASMRLEHKLNLAYSTSFQPVSYVLFIKQQQKLLTRRKKKKQSVVCTIKRHIVLWCSHSRWCAKTTKMHIKSDLVVYCVHDFIVAILYINMYKIYWICTTYNFNCHSFHLLSFVIITYINCQHTVVLLYKTGLRYQRYWCWCPALYVSWLLPLEIIFTPKKINIFW